MDDAGVGGVGEGDELEGLAAFRACGVEEELNGTGFPEGLVVDTDIAVVYAEGKGEGIRGDVELAFGDGVA